MQDKLKVARLLDDLGVAYIEGGWPGSNPKDIDFFNLARDLPLKNSRLAAFGSTRRAKLAPEEDPILVELIKSDAPVITIFGKSSDPARHRVCAAHDARREPRNDPDSSLAYLKRLATRW